MHLSFRSSFQTRKASAVENSICPRKLQSWSQGWNEKSWDFHMGKGTNFNDTEFT